MRGKIQMALYAALLAMAGGCSLLDSGHAIVPPRGIKPSEYVVITTGYCACSECCGWKRTWYGRPVYASGPLKGKHKIIGQTASGTMARPGTLAADTSVFPFGTIMYIPGYGYGRVEDRGSAIKGYHVDLYHRTHAAAKQHGRQRMKVKVWFPESG